ncbi:MAG: hypothetical protein F4X12_22115 [Acidobacteriia bacterium]|nr:hypothetical protein [Terriglobia bacterium]
MTDHESEEAGMSGGDIYVDSEGIVRDGGGRRIEGIEVHSGREPTLDYPIFTDEDGKVDGVDMTVAENRRRLHHEMAGITEDDEKQLKGRMSNPKQMQHKAFVLDRHEKDKGKRWKYEAKVGVPLDPTVVHDTPKFPLGSVMVVREGEDPE